MEVDRFTPSNGRNIKCCTEMFSNPSQLGKGTISKSGLGFLKLFLWKLCDPFYFQPKEFVNFFFFQLVNNHNIIMVGKCFVKGMSNSQTKC